MRNCIYKQCICWYERIKCHFEKVIASPFSYLHTKNAKNDEKSTADEDNVADWTEGGQKSLNYKFEPWGSADDPVGSRKRHNDRAAMSNNYQGKEGK